MQANQLNPIYQTQLPLEGVAAHVAESVQELDRYMQAQQVGRPLEIVVGCVHRSAAQLAKSSLFAEVVSGAVQLSIVTIDPLNPDRDTLWDRVFCTSVSRAQTQALLEELQRWLPARVHVVADVVPWVDYPALPALPALWKYHPERMRALAPYGRAIAECGLRHKGLPTYEMQREVEEAFNTADTAYLAELPLRRRAARTRESGRALLFFRASLGAYATFNGNGRQIFDIPPQMSDLFRHTDVDDIQWANVRLPYPSLYLHFGPQPEMDLGGGWEAEGLYIQELSTDNGRYVNMQVVAAPPSLEAYLASDVTSPPTFAATLDPEQAAMPLADALELTLSNRMAQLRIEMTEDESPEKLREQARLQGIPDTGILVSIRKERATEEFALLTQRHDVYVKMLRLAVNALCYLTAYPADIQTRWPANTPASALKELDRAKDNRNERKKVLNRLARLGFSAVHLCGRKLAQELENQEQLRGTSGSVRATHWVRGHWRRQAYGEGRSLRRLEWRMPVVRRSRLLAADAADDAPLGHIYLAGP